MNTKKVLTWLGIAFVVFFVLQQPDSASGMVRNAISGVGDAADRLAQFVSSLA